MCCCIFSEDTSYDGIIIDKCFAFDIFMKQTQTSPLPSEALLATILKIMVKSFMLIPKLYHVSFLLRDAQRPCKSYLVWYYANFRPTAAKNHF